MHYHVTLVESKLSKQYNRYWPPCRVDLAPIEADADGSSNSMVKVSQQHRRSWFVAAPPRQEQDASCRVLYRARQRLAQPRIGKARGQPTPTGLKPLAQGRAAHPGNGGNGTSGYPNGVTAGRRPPCHPPQRYNPFRAKFCVRVPIPTARCATLGWREVTPFGVYQNRPGVLRGRQRRIAANFQMAFVSFSPVRTIDETQQRPDAIADQTDHAIAFPKENRAALITAAVTGQIDVRNFGREAT